MAFKLPPVVEKHKMAFGVGAIVLFVLFYYMLSRGSGGTATASSSTAYDTAALQADAQLQMAQLQAQTEGSAQAAQLTAQSNQLGADLQATLNTNQTQVQLASISAQGTQNVAQIQANVDTAGITAQEQIAAQNAAENEYLATTQSGTILGTEQIAATMNTSIAQMETQANVNIAQINSNTTLGLAQYQSATTISGQMYGAQAIESVASAQQTSSMFSNGIGAVTKIAGMLLGK